MSREKFVNDVFHYAHFFVYFLQASENAFLDETRKREYNEIKTMEG